MIQTHNFIRNSAKFFFPISLLPGLPKINYKPLKQMLYNYRKVLTAKHLTYLLTYSMEQSPS